MRLAYFSPLNPVQSGISDYSEELIPWLNQWLDIDLFVDGYQPASPGLQHFAIFDARSFPGRASRYGAVIYHMGNSPAHAYIYRMLLRVPGVVVLHEHVLHHLITWMSLNHGDTRLFVDEFKYCYGAPGESLARRIISGQASVEVTAYPLCNRVVNAARGLIVHSDHVRQAVLGVRPDAPLQVVPMGIPLPPDHEEGRAEARSRLGLAPDEFVIGSFGHINPFKRLDVALRAFRRFLKTHPLAQYILVGSPSPHYDIAATIDSLGLGNRARLTGYVEPQEFQDYVSAADVCVNLRYPSAGETSASMLRLMGSGLPVLVSRTAAFEELPDGACLKVDVGECEGDLVLEYLRLLADNPTFRRRLGDNARRYVAEQHTMEQATAGYLDALRLWYPGQVPERPLRPLAVSTPDLRVARRLTEDREAPLAERTGNAAPSFSSDVLDMIADAASELGLGAYPPAWQDAAQAWVDLVPAHAPAHEGDERGRQNP